MYGMCVCECVHVNVWYVCGVCIYGVCVYGVCVYGIVCVYGMCIWRVCVVCMCGRTMPIVAWESLEM